MSKKTAASKPKTISWDRQYEAHGKDIHVFNIEFEDGTSGIFSTTKKEQTKFEIGKSVNYSAETLTNRNNEQYVKIDIVKESQPYNRGRKNSPEIDRSILANVCLDAAVNSVVNLGYQDKVTEDLSSVHGIADKFYSWIMEKSGNDSQARITYQARLKEVTGMLISIKPLNITTSDKILEFVEKEYNYVFTKMKS